MGDDDDHLIDDYLDDALDPAGVARFEAWLQRDRANRRRFVVRAAEHRALALRLAREERTVGRGSRRRGARASVVATALLALVLLGGAWWLARHAPADRTSSPAASGAVPPDETTEPADRR